MVKKRKASSPLQASPPSTSSHQARTRQDIEELRQQLSILKERVDELELENDGMQQRARQCCLVFAGSAIPEPSRGEDIVKLLQELLLKNMGCNLILSEVKSAFRLGGKTILVKFVSSGRGSNRDLIFTSKTRLRGSGLFISESLTSRRRHILRSLLQLKKAQQISSVFTQSSDIFIRETSSSPPIRIPDMSAVRQLTLARAVSQRPEQGRAQSGSARSRARAGRATDTSLSVAPQSSTGRATRALDRTSTASTCNLPPPLRSGPTPAPPAVRAAADPSSLDAPLPVAQGSPPVRPALAAPPGGDHGSLEGF